MWNRIAANTALGAGRGGTCALPPAGSNKVISPANS
jgi:hypothetical protein